MTQPTHYFAYGSNLNFRDWRKHRRDLADPATILEPVGTAWLPDLELCFDYHSSLRGGGALDLRPRRGQRTAGVVFRVRGDGWQQLDRKEGAPACYERFATVALTSEGGMLPVTTYRVAESRRSPVFVPPTADYLAAVEHGLQQYHLDPRMLLAAARDEVVPLELDALFVYGTLLRGESRRHHLDRHDILCTLLAQSPGVLLDFADYPGLVLAPGQEAHVQGEFVRSRDVSALLGELDEVEEFVGYDRPDSLFERRIVPVHVGDGRVREAWTYIAAPAAGAGTPIAGGDWRAHHGRKAAFLDALALTHCAGAKEEQLARRIVGQHPFPPVNSLTAAAQELMPLREAFANGTISERQLAQASKKWNVIPD